jgi:hypothetical protein
MNENEVYELLQTGKLTITFDTNALYGDIRFLNVCDEIDEINNKLKYEIKIVISSLAHAEKLFHLKKKHKEEYDIGFINQVLKRKKVNIVPFEPDHAEAVAKWISTQFPTSEEWQMFKRQECINCLGINEDENNIPGSGKKCGARVDWLIAGYAQAKNYLLITNDKGNEFKHIEKKTTLKILEKSVNKILELSNFKPK